MQAKPPRIDACTRCGACCRAGGPALHREDRQLIVAGHIHTRDLYTIRRGEMAYDQIRGVAQPTRADIIKIKGQGRSWTCRLFDAAAGACRIYAERPLECRLLECWNTDRLARAYARGRLTRRDVIGEIQGVWAVVEEHQRRCDHRRVLKLLAPGPDGRAERRRRELAAMVRYDEELRARVLARIGLEAEMLDFLFGRPLRRTLPGLKAAPAPGGAPAGV
ncbi:MAG: YkgJ family cysteine cluster protein [Desulfobacterales bacterium]|nr:YkgJ family cysteine cluster protein [Desulfobacterales bacterium]